jgi:hypothetical protein
MHTYTIFFPNEYDELVAKLATISEERDISISTLLREMISEYNGFEPIRVREIKPRRKNKSYQEQDEKK